MQSYKTEIKWAFIFIASMLVWMILERAVGLHDEHIDKHMIYTNFFAIVAFVVYYLALKDKRDSDYAGVISYKQAFIAGVIMSVVIMLFTPLTQYIVSYYITPNYFTNVINYSVANNLMTQEAAEAYFNFGSYVIQSTIFSLVMGVITTAIMAFFVKTASSTND
jgi:uncharacterized membrane protein YvlD (DUF360 family)